jgi:HK97 family phage major capsid protein
MTIAISEKEELAVRKHSLPTLRKIGVTNLADYAPHTLDWSTLNEHSKDVMKACRSLLDQISEDTEQKQAASIEGAHDALIAAYDAIEREKDIRTKIGKRTPREGSGSPFRPIPMDGETSAAGDLDNGGSGYTARSGWADKAGAEVRVLKPNEPLSQERWDGPSLGDCLRAMITGPRNEMERRTLSEGTDSAGGFTVPVPLARIYIDKLRAASVVMRAGAQTVDMTSETLAIARLASDPTMAWRAENAEITASDPTFERVLFNAYSLASLVKTSRELMEDTVNAGAMLENAFVQAAALEFDRAALYGTGSGATMPEGVGVISGINSVSMGTNGAAITTDAVSDALYEIELDNAPTPTAMIYHPRTGNELRKLKDGEGRPVTWHPDIAAIPRLATTSVPINQTQGGASNASSLLMGHFPHMMVGLRSALRIELLKERYAEFLQYGFVAHMRGDVQLAHKASFCKLIGIIPA